MENAFAEKIVYYEIPQEIVLRYREIVEDPFPQPQEAEVTFQINGHSEQAFVPLRSVDKENQHVRAAIIGEYLGNVLVSFPPTNFGQTMFQARRDDLQEITVSDGPGETSQ